MSGQHSQKTKPNLFRIFYIAFVLLLIILVVSSVLYVRKLLVSYENSQPERQVETAIVELSKEANAQSNFWKKYSLPELSAGEFEADSDIQKKYTALFSDENLSFTAKTGTYAEDELCYEVKKGSFPIAEVMLKAKGPAQTKLAVFSIREWKVTDIKPVIEPREYTVSMPSDFGLSINGKKVSKEYGKQSDDGKTKYTVSGVYLEPEFEITDADGSKAKYVVRNFKVLPEYYDYTLTLPSSLDVKVNGDESSHTELADGRLRHDIMALKKPKVLIKDKYGNMVSYTGGDLPLTYKTILTPEDYNVTIDGKPLAESEMTESVDEEYDLLKDLVKNLPTQTKNTVAILKKDANITVTDAAGNAINFDRDKSHIDLTDSRPTLDSLPKDVSDKVDVLKTAQSWSLFMSNDLSFQNMAKLMLPNSYQYDVAKRYSTSVDKSFFSKHTLLDPAFTDNEVKNFVWITDDSFSVDISFVKHMHLTNTNKKVDDAMNDRFYFVLKNNKWLLAGLKEVSDGE